MSSSDRPSFLTGSSRPSTDYDSTPSSPSSPAVRGKPGAKRNVLKKELSKVEKELHIFKAKLKDGDDDARQRVEVLGRFLASSYQVSMGSLLLLFIPQECPDSGSLNPDNTHICSMNEILYPFQQKAVNPYAMVHFIALVINITSFLVNLVLYAAELNRETWCIDNLDIDHDLPDTNAKAVLKDNPTLDREFTDANDWYCACVKWSLALFVLNNIVVSPFALFMVPHGGISSSTATKIALTPFISHTALLLMRLNTAKFVMTQSKLKKLAYSAYMIELVSYNVIDPDVVGTKGGSDARERQMTKLERDYEDLTAPQPHALRSLPVTMRARHLLKNHRKDFNNAPHQKEWCLSLAGGHAKSD